MARLSHYAPGEYRPIAMRFDGMTGMTGGYLKEHSPTGTTVFAMGRFRIGPWQGPSFANGVKTILIAFANGTTFNAARLHVFVCSGSRVAPSSNWRFGFNSRSSADVITVTMISKREVADNHWHSFLISWNAATGAYVFKLDGEDADDTTAADRIAPVINTMASTANSLVIVGNAQNFSGGVNTWGGDISVLAYGNGYLTNWDDFFFPNNLPKRLDHVGWTELGAGVYAPAMMQFNGSTGYYSKSFTSVGNKVVAVCLFKRASFTGASAEVLMQSRSSGGFTRLQLSIYANNHATVGRREKIQLFAQNSAGVAVCSIWSSIPVTDDQLHMIMVSYDGDLGTAVMYIDSVDRKDTGNAEHNLTTGVLAAGVGTTLYVGVLFSLSLYYSGLMGFAGHTDAYLTNHNDFMVGNKPIAIDEDTWRQWRVQPKFYQSAAAFNAPNIRSSEGAMTANGTITVVPGSMPSLYHPYCDLENNLGLIGSMRRIGKCFPVVSEVPVRSGMNAPQNTGGVILHFTPPRAAKSPVVLERSMFQEIVPGITVTLPSGWSTDANGYVYKDSPWEAWLTATGLPAKAATTRMYQLHFRYEDVAPPGVNPGFVLGFNYLDIQNFWRAVFYFTAGTWKFEIGDLVANVWTARVAVALSSAINYPLQGVMTIFDDGDTVVGSLHTYEVDVPTDFSSTPLQYTVASRPLKTQTGVILSHHEDPDTNMRYRSFLVMDM